MPQVAGGRSEGMGSSAANGTDSSQSRITEPLIQYVLTELRRSDLNVTLYNIVIMPST